MKRLLLIVTLILTQICAIAQEVVVSSPIRNYPLNNKSGIEKIGRHDGTISGTVENYPDRFGNATGAMKFPTGTYISTPNFFNGSSYQSGFTIVFWTYIDENYEKYNGVKPWQDWQSPFQAFYAQENGQNLLGFYRKNDRAVIDRYVKNADNKNKNWGIWLWDPLNFTNRQGWYMIALSYETNKMTTYMFYPSGHMECSMHYFSIQDLSTASSWGIGSNSSHSLKIMDDFRVYNYAMTKQQVRAVFGREALPSGMYEVSIAANSAELIHPISSSTSQYTKLELQPYENAKSHTYRWVFEPVTDKPNVFKIRMAYHSTYIHLSGNYIQQSTALDILEYDSNFAQCYEWFVEPSGDGYFYIRSNANRSLYMHTASHSYSSGARLEAYGLNTSYAPVYKWRLNLVKTKAELDENPFNETVAYETVCYDNTFLTLYPQTPISSTGTATLASRGTVPNLYSFWYYKKDIDDSYRITNRAFNTYYLHLTGRTAEIGTSVQLLKYQSAHAPYYRWTIEKTNPHGRKYIIRPVLNHTAAISAGEKPQIGTGITLKKAALFTENALEWQMYNNNEQAPAAKEVYDLKPGIYKIRSMEADNMYIAPQAFNWSGSTRLTLQQYDDSRFTSYYWEVEYETDGTSEVHDGSYVIKLFSANTYMHTVEHALTTQTRLEHYHEDRNYIGTFKFFIKPTRDGSGSYFIISAGNPKLYMHLWSHSAAQDSPIELLFYNGSYANTYKWKFEKVSIIAPFASGTHKFALAKDQSKFLHVKERSSSEGAKLEILPYASEQSSWYIWNIIKNPDNTYSIKRNGSNQYVHPTSHSSAESTQLEDLLFNANYSPYYKWIVESGSTPNSYRFRLVADPSKYMHVSGHSSESSTNVELLKYNRSYSNSYEWILQTP